jgi:pyridoxine 5-phosphate synthase
MRKLSVNVDHVATIREARKTDEPDPVLAAGLAELAGAHGIIVHLREDRRHIQDRDLEILRKTIKTRLNLEMAATREMVGIALEIKPDLVTLVPEKREELTTEGGLNVLAQQETLKKAIRVLKGGEIPVSLFVDPDLEQIKASHRVGAQIIEIHTGHYCDALGEEAREEQFERIMHATHMGAKLKLKVAAGHGLNYRNVHRLLTIPEIGEFSIGHSIIARAVLVGMARAVGEMLAILNLKQPDPDY